MASDNQERFRDRMARMSDLAPYGVFLAFVGVLKLLPYGLRVRLGGFVFARLVAPFAGYRNRIEDNLRLIFPEMPEAQ